MNRSEKQSKVQELNELVSSSSIAVVVEYRGLTVLELTELRRKLRDATGKMTVAKNSFVKRAVVGTDAAPISDFMVGPTAVITGEDPVAVAKALVDAGKAFEKLELKGGALDGKALKVNELEALSKLPSKEQLLATLLATMQAPASSFARLLNAVPTSLLYALNAIKDQKEA